MAQTGIFVTGTDTDVGKTWVGKHLIHQLCKMGISVIPRKPVESGWQDNTQLSDAWKLAFAANREKELDLVCPNRFKAAISPERAARLENRVLKMQTVVEQCLNGLHKNDFLYVEGAGGFFSPLVSDGSNADLAKAIKLPVLLVAADRLGCINHILLSLSAIYSYGLETVGIVLNQVNEMDQNPDMDNLQDLRELTNIPVYRLGHQQQKLPDRLIEAIIKPANT